VVDKLAWQIFLPVFAVYRINHYSTNDTAIRNKIVAFFCPFFHHHFANKLELIQQKFSAFRFNCFFPHVRYSYSYASEQLKLHTLRKGSYHLNALIFIQGYLCFEFCPLWKLFVFEILQDISQTFLCSVSALQMYFSR
jgi:hypothetical protein